MDEFKVPATSANLGPGYDTIGMALNLFNKFQVKKRKDNLIKIKVIDKSNNNQILELNPKNDLISIAYQSYFKFIKQKAAGVEIIETMETPLARGLGSSASAIIGGLTAAAIVSGKLIAEKDFIKLAVALEKHPDNVVPALVGGLTINYNCNEDYSYYKINLSQNLSFVLVVPDFELKTKELRAVLPKKINYPDAIFNLSRTALFTAAFINNEFHLLKKAMEDKIHQPYRKRLIEEFDQVIDKAYAWGAYGAALSGAGPTIIAVADKNNEKIAEEMQKPFKAKNIKSSSFILKGCNYNLYEYLKGRQ
ncbi:homoserine kinase [Halanaerobium sp. Z-7514]|uniref:Homoserine kinase n=1 Tax=Halanaerobium polyolivorans TaxID=2886943 RepID=A0AAW4WRW6_9FIRM|nr:homoserine kinase [Halanaerobium polyolivorans]MCC3143848.1 homoserine kinase [Halanaerobium polyolivorans]